MLVSSLLTHNPMNQILNLIFAASLLQLAPGQTPVKNPPPSPQQQAETHYQKGQSAENAGDLETATQAYTAALKANPNHANAKYSLAQLKIDAPKITAKGREAKFGSVMLSEFNVTDMTLLESLEFLRNTIHKKSEGKVAPNFIIQDPKNLISSVKIDLKLKNMPARAVMKYLLDQSGAKARYDEFAIVITPL